MWFRIDALISCWTLNLWRSFVCFDSGQFSLIITLLQYIKQQRNTMKDITNTIEITIITIYDLLHCPGQDV